MKTLIIEWADLNRPKREYKGAQVSTKDGYLSVSYPDREVSTTSGRDRITRWRNVSIPFNNILTWEEIEQ